MTVQAPAVDAVARAQIQHSWALMQVASYATGLVPADAVAGPGEHVITSARLAVLQVDVGMTAVMLERARGTSWHILAMVRGQPVGSFRAIYEGHYQRWCEGVDYPWRPEGVTDLPEPCPADLAAAAARIDSWYMDTVDPIGRDGFTRNRTPVGSVLRRDDL